MWIPGKGSLGVTVEVKKREGLLGPAFPAPVEQSFEALHPFPWAVAQIEEETPKAIAPQSG